MTFGRNNTTLAPTSLHEYVKPGDGLTMAAMQNGRDELAATEQFLLRTAVAEGWTRQQIIETYSALFGEPFSVLRTVKRL